MTNGKATDVLEVLKEFAEKSSSPSLTHVSTARCLAGRIFWICIAIGATSGVAYHLYKIISTYMEHNYYTSITNDFEQPLKVGSAEFCTSRIDTTSIKIL